MCAYYRYHYPIEFLTSFLNNAANEDDVRNGTAYANKIGIKVTMPKWGFSKGDYFFDKEKRIIAKGLTSVKYIGAKVAESLYNVSKETACPSFVEVLNNIFSKTKIDARQLEILIKIDFFSDFGNQRELLRLFDIYEEIYDRGNVKKISKSKVDGTPLERIVSKYSVGVTKSGGVAKSYTVLDIQSIMHETELAIKESGMSDLDDKTKIKNFEDIMGYAGYVSGRPEDRRKLYILDIYPLLRKKDSKQFGYSIITKSIGSGKESRFTVFNRTYNLEPISKGDIIFCKTYERDGQYYQLSSYDRLS